MLSSAAFRLILLISCAHALVHIYELSLPSVEQEIALEFHPNDPSAGKEFTGLLSNSWRLMWGFGALLAGWLVDRIGGKSMLAIYLLGCSITCGSIAMSSSVPSLFGTMILMGSFASIYHPAGLALISHETSAANRTQALGLHGILGSLGIASAPFIAWAIVSTGFNWRNYYWILALPAAVFGTVFFWLAIKDKRIAQRTTTATSQTKDLPEDNEETCWPSFVVLLIIAMLQGLVYAAMMSFLPRYLSVVEIRLGNASDPHYGKVLAAGVLAIGCLGQYLAGRFGRSSVLERQLSSVMLASVPLLLWLAFAASWWRVLAAGAFALVHFMNQPLYNSLVAKYTPASRRSLCYGVNFVMGFGMGSFGAAFAAFAKTEWLTYGSLAGVSTLSAALGYVLWRWHRPSPLYRS